MTKIRKKIVKFIYLNMSMYNNYLSHFNYFTVSVGALQTKILLKIKQLINFLVRLIYMTIEEFINFFHIDVGESLIMSRYMISNTF